MKKIIFFILLFTSVVSAGEIDKIDFKHKKPASEMYALIVGFSSAPASSDCESGTYLSYWTGDNSALTADEDTICFNNGTEIKQGTVNLMQFSTSYGDGGSIGTLYNASSDYVSWPVSSEDLVSKTEGTVWIKFRVASTVSITDTAIWMMFSDTTPASNYIKLHIENSSADQMRMYYFSGGVSYRADSTATITADGSTWNIVGGSWRINAGVDVAVTIGNTWASGTVEQDRDFAAFTGTPDYMIIGNEGGQSIDIHIDTMAVLSTWEAACPF